MKKVIFFPIILIGLFLLASTLPLQKSVNAATSTPPSYPPFPTATVYAPITEASDVFVNEESGFSIKIPNKVKATNSSPDRGLFQEYEIGNGEIFGYLYPANMQLGDSLQEVGESNRDLQIKKSLFPAASKPGIASSRVILQKVNTLWKSG
jgi:hypothetical protein